MGCLSPPPNVVGYQIADFPIRSPHRPQLFVNTNCAPFQLPPGFLRSFHAHRMRAGSGKLSAYFALFSTRTGVEKNSGSCARTLSVLPKCLPCRHFARWFASRVLTGRPAQSRAAATEPIAVPGFAIVRQKGRPGGHLFPTSGARRKYFQARLGPGNVTVRGYRLSCIGGRIRGTGCGVWARVARRGQRDDSDCPAPPRPSQSVRA